MVRGIGNAPCAFGRFKTIGQRDNLAVSNISSPNHRSRKLHHIFQAAAISGECTRVDSAICTNIAYHLELGVRLSCSDPDVSVLQRYIGPFTT